jgi:hypothetical protein
MTETTGLLAAMLAVQGEAPTLPKDATNPHYKSRYTPLDTVVEVVGPILNKHGLVWSTLPGRDEHGDPALTYRLSHAATGEALEGTMPLLLSKQDAQGQGSAITYARRYSLCAVLNLVADDDDDGARAAAGRQASGSAREPAASEKQIKYVRTLFARNKVTVKEIRVLLKGAGVTETEDVVAAVDGLTGVQASMIIETLKDGPVPTGESDVPSDASGFERPPVVDDGSLPFSPEVPQ